MNKKWLPLVFVTLIIGLLVAISIPAIFGLKRKSSESQTKQAMKDGEVATAQSLDETEHPATWDAINTKYAMYELTKTAKAYTAYTATAAYVSTRDMATLRAGMTMEIPTKHIAYPYTLTPPLVAPGMGLSPGTPTSTPTRTPTPTRIPLAPTWTSTEVVIEPTQPPTQQGFTCHNYDGNLNLCGQNNCQYDPQTQICNP